ncbi:phosphoinositide-specific phospholipase C [Aspergillus heteromorphus CBS 117.55]|uniref:Phosphoinositide phospholipase C n=1 Tax=Aspergillus heteromorphus CBS 117.55 TaxID=1448321 RepID=A0A317X584_9EURO|nr:phosphoinositide-specific phospholipase C [Aspergillus heteromorphus CBS 117.55]PWY92697.1 phosphoinositide-specific phospholipase C [Aspergillus heteromorphus CBS 117.55]
MDKLTTQTSRMTVDSTNSDAPNTELPFSPSFLSYFDKIYASLTALTQHDFLKDVQREGGQGKSDPLATLAELYEYMASPEAAAMRPASSLDLSAPITDYFVSTSHNTYLTGNQLYSDAEASSYTNVGSTPYIPHSVPQTLPGVPKCIAALVLLSGCRSVEIDVWDGKGESEDDDVHSSNSDSESEEEKTGSVKPRRRSKTERLKSATSGHPRLHAISEEFGKLEGFLGHHKPSIGSGSSGKSAGRPEPRVLHGHTLTRETSFREVCYAIRDSAFVTNDLPVIVSLEVHACLEQQQTMVDIMEEAWAGMLIQVTPEIEARVIPPPLEDLKRKILIKVKHVDSADEDDDREAKEKAMYSEHMQALKQDRSPTNSVDLANSTASPPPRKHSKISQALSKMAIFTKGFHFHDFASPEAKVPSHVFSLSESAVREAHAKDREALFEHNRHFFMRVYPAGMRVNSSNMDPSFFWRRGAQMVALNWQSLDKGMMLNRGMFAGGLGWVLKPPGYRGADTEVMAPTLRQLDLTIEILAGQNIPLPAGHNNEQRFHPYVTCLLHVETPDDEPAAADEDSESEKSGYKHTTQSAHGASPDFGEQKLQFPTVSGIIDELTFVRFKIKDNEFLRDALAAWACIRLDRLREGYRLIRLYDHSGLETEGTLLVRITKAYV